MATLQLVNTGTLADDGTGDPLRTAFDRINNSLNALNNELAAVATLDESDFMRIAFDVACDGTEGQVIAYTSEFLPTHVVRAIDKNGVGIEVTAQDENGFTITSFSESTFDYVAFKTV